MKSTADWEALLAAATPGPWEVVKCHATWKQASPEENALIPERRREFTVTLATPVDGADIVATSDTYLIAAAPEVVAELVRLRREVAAFRDQMTKSAKWRKAMHDGGDDTGHLLGAEYDRQIASRLTRILEGDTDEWHDAE